MTEEVAQHQMSDSDRAGRLRGCRSEQNCVVGEGVRIVGAAGGLVNEMVGKDDQMIAEFLGESRRFAHRCKIDLSHKQSEFHPALPG